MEILYESVQERLIDNYKFLAMIHGVDIDFDSQSGKSVPPVDSQQSQINPNFPLFQDPKVYEHLTVDEKEQLTKKMMNRHSSWVGDNTGSMSV